MGGHGASSGFSKAQKEVNELYAKLENGDIKLGEYTKGKLNIADKYGISIADINGMSQSGLDVKPKQGSAQTSTTDVAAAKNLPGQNGNPWPPDAGKNHLNYEGGGGLGIWNQFGGGAKNGGVSSSQAKQMYNAVDSFTGNHYDDIRSAMQNGDTTSTYGKQGVMCEKFISAGVKAGQGWNGGATYRGVGGLSNKALQAIHNMKPGDSIDCNWGGCASWSTKRSVSEHFGSSYNHVTFVHLGARSQRASR